MISEADARAAASSWPKVPEVARDVLLEVLIHGPLSRAELAGRMGLNRSTILALTAELTAAGLVAEESPRDTGRAPPDRSAETPCSGETKECS